MDSGGEAWESGVGGGVRDEFDQNIFYTCVTFSVNKNIVLNRRKTEKVFLYNLNYLGLLGFSDFVLVVRPIPIPPSSGLPSF